MHALLLACLPPPPRGACTCCLQVTWSGLQKLEAMPSLTALNVAGVKISPDDTKLAGLQVRKGRAGGGGGEGCKVGTALQLGGDQ